MTDIVVCQISKQVEAQLKHGRVYHFNQACKTKVKPDSYVIALAYSDNGSATHIIGFGRVVDYTVATKMAYTRLYGVPPLTRETVVNKLTPLGIPEVNLVSIRAVLSLDTHLDAAVVAPDSIYSKAASAIINHFAKQHKRPLDEFLEDKYSEIERKMDAKKAAVEKEISEFISKKNGELEAVRTAEREKIKAIVAKQEKEAMKRIREQLD